MTDPTNTDEPTPAPAPTVDTSAPQWAVDLKRTLDELPGRLQATISDDDKAGIAETVHGLFERSGAFERRSESDSAEDEADAEATTTEREVEDTSTEAPPAKGSKFSKFAQWFNGE